MDLGLLFQIQDDILDVTHDPIRAGKTTQNDQAKNSFVTLLGLEKSREEVNVLASKLTHQMERFEDHLRNELSPTLTHYINRHKENI